MGNDTTTVTEGIIPQESHVLFENAETFEIKGNTIIEKGATFAIKNKNTSKLGQKSLRLTKKKVMFAILTAILKEVQ